MKKEKIVIGSRGSDLALWQANYVKGLLEEKGHTAKIKIIKTKGDIIQHLSFDKMEGKGFFTKELETALRKGEVDLAVHSFKDLETRQPDDLVISAILNRANPADVLLIRKSCVDEAQPWRLKWKATVGTSSTRRKMQVRNRRPDVVTSDIRGNVPTRIERLRKGDFDAIVLAKAGIDRLELDLSDLEVVVFDPREFIPAPAQGALACQIRAADTQMADILKTIHHPEVAEMVTIERKVLSLFEGGCQLPLGAYGEKTPEGINLHAIMAPRFDAKPRRVTVTAHTTAGLAEKAVEELKKKSTR